MLNALEEKIGYCLMPSNPSPDKGECSVVPLNAKVISDIADRTLAQIHINNRIADFIGRLAL